MENKKITEKGISFDLEFKEPFYTPLTNETFKEAIEHIKSVKQEQQELYRKLTPEELEKLASECWKYLDSVQQQEVYNKVFNGK